MLDLPSVGEDPIESSTDIHAVCDLVKSWFRVLPEPVFPSTDYHLVIEAMRAYTLLPLPARPDAIFSELENLDDRLTSIRNVVQGLPRPNFDLLKRVSEHLDKCVSLLAGGIPILTRFAESPTLKNTIR